MSSKSKQVKEVRKLKILMLHGYYQSGDILNKKTGSFRKIINKVADFVYITAPNEVSNKEAGVKEVSEEGPVFKWWDVENGEYLTAERYIGDKNSIEFIKEVFRNQGPFDGILGFSQGGVLASILCGMRAGNEATIDNPIAFKFAIIVSAFTPSCIEYVPYIKNKSKLPPTLHLFGKGDTLILPEWSRKLTEYFPEPMIVEHDGGHYIPVTSAPKQAYKIFLDQFLKESI